MRWIRKVQANAVSPQSWHVHIVEFHEPPVLPESPHVQAVDSVFPRYFPHVSKEHGPWPCLPDEFIPRRHFTRFRVDALLHRCPHIPVDDLNLGPLDRAETTPHGARSLPASPVDSGKFVVEATVATAGKVALVGRMRKRLALSGTHHVVFVNAR